MSTIQFDDGDTKNLLDKLNALSLLVANGGNGGAGTPVVLGADFIGNGTAQLPIQVAKDPYPVQGSSKLILSGAMFTALAEKKVQLIPRFIAADNVAAHKDFLLVDTTKGNVTINMIVTPANKTVAGVKHIIQGNTNGVPNVVTINLHDGSKFNTPNGPTSLTLGLLNQSFTAMFDAPSGLWIIETLDLPLSQFDLRFNKLLLIANPQTANYTLALADDYVRMTVAVANTLTIPPNSLVAFPVGKRIQIEQGGTGQTTITAAAGVIINSAGGTTKTRLQYSMATLIKKAADTWLLTGDIV